MRRFVTTVLGVAWGTFAVVGLGAFGAGLEESMATRAAGMGEAIVIAWPGRTTKAWQGVPEGRAIRLRSEEVRQLATRVPGVAAISPEASHYSRMAVGTTMLLPEVTGVDPAYGALRNVEPQPGGRFLSPRDLAEARPVIFLGDRLARNLFGAEEPVGQELIMGETPFRVVGVMQPKEQDSDYGSHDTARAFVPMSTYERVFGARYVENFVVGAHRPELLPEVVRGLYTSLSRSHGFDPMDRDALSLWDTTEADEIRGQIFDAMDLLMLLAGTFTVLVGAIGVGNLMFLVVKRRTPEIGLRMALGARPASILRGILAEALGWVALGGALGFLAAAGLAGLVGASPLSEDLGQPQISTQLALGVVVLLMVVGLGAGWFPARRAARLDPALALAEGA